jgi:hypothetical protein
MNFLFLFLDGVGLGPNDPQSNPLAVAEMPVLQSLLGGRKMLLSAAPFKGPRATLLSLDPNLGVDGIPQSATGQAVLVTGRNVPAEVGLHFGPKPSPEIARILDKGNIFKTVREAGGRAALLNAYPPGYFDAIASGKRMYSSIPHAVTAGGIRLKTVRDFYDGEGMAADFTGQGWREHLGYDDSPLFEPEQAGQNDFSFFEFWISDYIGHYQDMPGAVEMLQNFDRVLGGLLAAWDLQTGLIFLTSDHGNLEDLSTKRHTTNPVPGLTIGAPSLRQSFTAGLRDLTDVTPAICDFLGV